VTGASGFIGANLVRRLLAEGEPVVALLRDTTNPWRLPPGDDRLRIVRAALRPGSLRDQSGQFGAVDCVYHLAAAAVNQSVRDVPSMIDVNVMGTLAALELAERLGVRRFVYVGSSGEYGPCVRAREDQLPAPNAEYGATKTAGWSLAQAFGRRSGLSVVAVRPFSVFGPFEAAYRLVPYCTLRAIDGQPVNVTAGTQTRDFIFIDDVLDGIQAAARVPHAAGGTFNLCTGISTSIREMVLGIVRVCGGRSEPVFGGAPLAATEMWTTSGDPGHSAEVLGWRATRSLEQGLQLTRDWLQKHRQDFPEYATARVGR
jgi:nucleoside-diphosphate-sugar epimerase